MVEKQSGTFVVSHRHLAVTINNAPTQNSSFGKVKTYLHVFYCYLQTFHRVTLIIRPLTMSHLERKSHLSPRQSGAVWGTVARRTLLWSWSLDSVYFEVINTPQNDSNNDTDTSGENNNALSSHPITSLHCQWE